MVLMLRKLTMGITNYSSVTKFEQHYTDSNGKDVKTTIEFDSLCSTHEEMCEQFADFLRAVGYSYIESVVAYKVGEDDHS